MDLLRVPQAGDGGAHVGRDLTDPAAGRPQSGASVQRRLLSSARLARGALTAAVVIGLAIAALAVAQAWLLARAIAGAIEGGDSLDDLAAPIAALAAVLVVRAILGWAAEVVAQRISGAVKAALRMRLLERLLVMDAASRTPAGGRSTGEVALLVTRGLESLDAFYGRYLPQAALAAIVPLAVVGCLAVVDLVAAITVALTVPLIPVFMVLIGRLSAEHRSRRWQTLGRLAHRFADVVAGLPTLRAFGRGQDQVAILRRVTDAYRRATLQTLRVAFLSALALELLATISVALVAVGIGLRLAAGGMELETGLFALVLAPEAYLPLRRLGAEFHASEEGVAAGANAFAILDAPAIAPPDRFAPPARIGRIVVDRISVAQPGRELLAPCDASLSVRPGEIVAITGASGAGKSTLLAAVLALVEPSAGRVLVEDPDGTPIDVRVLAADAWYRCVGWVPQAPWLFAGSVGDNVRLGAPTATDDEIAAALATVGLRDVSPGLLLGERGMGLSSGQRRRLGIARALVRHAPVLLFDEPTAGLDEAAEARVLAAIRAEADRGAAVLLVAHRPGAIAGADRAVEVRARIGVGVEDRGAGDGPQAAATVASREAAGTTPGTAA